MPSRDERRAALRKRESIQVYVTAEDKRRIEDARVSKRPPVQRIFKGTGLSRSGTLREAGPPSRGEKVSYEEKAPHRGPTVTGRCLAEVLETCR